MYFLFILFLAHYQEFKKNFFFFPPNKSQLRKVEREIKLKPECFSLSTHFLILKSNKTFFLFNNSDRKIIIVKRIYKKNKKLQ